MLLVAHPAAEIFRVMDGDEFELLKADIQKHGQRDGIVLLDGRILDGRNRYRVCCELGIEPSMSELDECDDPVAYVISRNLARRHLSKAEAAAIAAEHLPKFRAEAEARKAAGQKLGGRGHKKTIGKYLPIVYGAGGKAVEQAAKLVGVSPEYVRVAKKLKDESPEVFEQVKAGMLSLPAAKRLATKRLTTKRLTTKRLTTKRLTTKRLATKENTQHREYWKCLECGSTELHLYGYCKPCWDAAPENQRREIAEGPQDAPAPPDVPLLREPGDDTDEIEAAAHAEQVARRNNGREMVTAKERREAQKAFGVVTRFIDRLGRHDELRPHLSALADVLEGRA